MALVVRRATPADAPVIADFNYRLAEESENKKLDRAVLSAGVAHALLDEHKCLYFVGEENGQVLGQMMITFEWSDWRNGWIWWIQSVYVRPEGRRKGVFKALFDHVRETARQKKVAALRLYVDQGNQIARQTYARLGLEPTSYVVLERCPV